MLLLYAYVYIVCVCVYFQVALMVKNLEANAGDPGSIPGSGKCPGGGHGNLLQ